MPSRPRKSQSDPPRTDKPFPDDPWTARNSLITPERAHAVGLLALYYNFCEINARELLERYSGMSREDAAWFTYDMKAPTMAGIIRGLIATKEPDEKVRDYIEHGLDAADTCRINRNAVIHSWINFSGDKLFSSRRQSSKAPITEVREFSLAEIRRCADEAFSIGHFFMFIGLYLAFRGDPHKHATLPDKPPLPHRLPMLDPLGTNIRKPPHQSSWG